MFLLFWQENHLFGLNPNRITFYRWEGSFHEENSHLHRPSSICGNAMVKEEEKSKLEVLLLLAKNQIFWFAVYFISWFTLDMDSSILWFKAKADFMTVKVSSCQPYYKCIDTASLITWACIFPYGDLENMFGKSWTFLKDQCIMCNTET